jgi:hypothetical protein
MTLSDTELEATLRRELHARADGVPPAPRDLAVLTRQRHRALRRREIGVAGAVLAAALVFVGVPVVAGTLADADRGQTAQPSPSRERRVSLDLADLPMRGSLAGDEEWLAGVLALDWLPPGNADVQGALDPPLDARSVAYAGDVPGARVALVLGDWAGVSWHIWFVGPQGASPDEMELATPPMEQRTGEAAALLDRADPSSDTTTLVIVGFPGDSAEVLANREVDASGEVVDDTQAVPMSDGAGAVEVAEEVDLLTNGGVWIGHGSGDLRQVFPERSSRSVITTIPRFAVTDPRGIAGTVDDAVVQEAAQCLTGYFGTLPEQLGVTLLAAGPVGDDLRTDLALVGVTFPSGATTACLAEQQNGPEPGSVGWTSSLVDPLPANGAPLVDQVFAMPSVFTSAIAISAPGTGQTAQLYSPAGHPLYTVPLVDGAGVAPLPPPAPAPGSVRILDATGAVVVEAPLSHGQN